MSGKGVIVLGASGHAKVCIELLRTMAYDVSWCIGQGNEPPCLDVPVLGGDHHLQRLRNEGYSQAFVAIGANGLRRRLADDLDALGFELVNAISPHAWISPSARIGKGVAVMAGAVVNADVQLADLSIINTGACIDHDCEIGIAAHVAPTCGLAGNVRVGAGAFLGIGAKVIPGIDIGADVIVGAGAVVVKNLLSGSKAMGVPAREQF